MEATAEVDIGKSEGDTALDEGENECYFGHPEFEVTVPFKEELHLASDSDIPSSLLQPLFH